MRYMISNIQVGITEGGVACGPIPGYPVAEISLSNELGEKNYYSVAAVEGTLNYYLSMESLFDRFLHEEDSDSFTETLDSCFVDSYDSTDYFYQLCAESMPLSNTLFIQKYLAYLALAGWTETNRLIENTQGAFIGEFEIPVSEEEQEVLDDMEE